ncbi:hypothetical protein SDC9_82713 [bioreactor metagenome]|uniref:Uncharacterized protein n=1 Tax=bioreactor metagenome TaxID=1076179 RepID=A0A644Z755_9ZZZZ
MPLADVGGLIPALFHIVGNSLDSGGQCLVVSETPCIGGIEPGLENGPARSTDRLRGESKVEAHTLLCQLIQDRGDVQLLSVTSAGIKTLLIRKVKENIRSAHHRLLLL